MSRQWGRAIAVVGLAVFVRGLALLAFSDSLARQPTLDPDAYADFARTLATTGVYGPAPDQPSAYRPPAYPLLLAPFASDARHLAAGALAIHFLATLVALVGTMRLADRLGATRPWLAGLWVALDPILIRQFTLLMTETVFTALLVALLVAWTTVGEGRERWGSIVATGFLLGAAALTRPIAWAVWLAIGVLRAGRAGERFYRDWLLALVVALFVVSPWAIRNRQALGAWIWTSTHGGYTLWLAQNPSYFDAVVAGPNAVWPEDDFKAWTRANLDETAGMTEVERDAAFRAKAWSWMRDHPTSAWRSLAYRERALWSPAPTLGPNGLRWICGAYALALYGGAMAALVRRSTWRRESRALFACLFAFAVVHAAYWSDVRMRAPLIPVFAILAALGVDARATGRERKDRLDADRR